MSKIAIVTIIDYRNYGNRLQAYALQNLVEAEGFEVFIGLDVFSKEDILEKTLSPQKRKIKAVLPLPLLEKAVERIRWKNSSAAKRDRERKFREFSARHLNELPPLRVMKDRDVACYVSPDSFDFFIAGSDQVWNPFFAGAAWNFLQFVRPEQRLSFAVSIGVNELPPNVAPRYREALSEMRYLSVREESAAKLIWELTGREAEVTLDPTLLLPAEEWDRLVQKPDVVLPERYILSFFLGEVPPAVEVFSQEKGLPVVYLNDLRFPALYALDPTEFLYVLGHADYVLTDSFHGTALSIKLHREFYVCRRMQEGMEDMFTRIEHILARFGLEEREQGRNQIVAGKEIDSVQWSEIDRILERERAVSMFRLKEQMKKDKPPESPLLGK